MHDNYMIPLLMVEMAFWMLIAFMSMRETRALRRRVAELESREAKGK